MRALAKDDIIFALGPAAPARLSRGGTGGEPADHRQRPAPDPLRPAVEAGERLGFLPGDMKEKVDPISARFTTHFTTACGRAVERRLARRDRDRPDRLHARAHARRCLVILDEAQNTTKEQMKMFLTRFGQNSRMVVCAIQAGRYSGRPAQSGLNDAVGRLEGVEGIAISRFNAGDVVRHRSWAGSSRPMRGKIPDLYGPLGEDPQESGLDQYRNRRSPRQVPAITLGFWIIKILATTLGETGGDTLSMTTTSAISPAARSLSSADPPSGRADQRAEVPSLALLGNDHRLDTRAPPWRISPRARSESATRRFAAAVRQRHAVPARLALRHRSIAVETVHTTKAEAFYWLTITFSQTLGTALATGPRTTAGWAISARGPVRRRAVVLVALWRLTSIDRVLLFWAASSSPGRWATVGDFLDKPLAKGGWT